MIALVWIELAVAAVEFCPVISSVIAAVSVMARLLLKPLDPELEARL